MTRPPGADHEDGARRAGGPRRALLLSGSLGMGHDVMAQACAASLARRGWETELLDAMRLLGDRGGGAGEAVFRRLISIPPVYDALHFSSLRTGNRLALALDGAARARILPRLEARLERHPVDLLVGVFATGASVAGQLKRRHPDLATAVFCTDVNPHRLWVHEGIDLYVVTSEVGGCYVRRFQPRAQVAVVPAPVRAPFYDPPTQREARARLGIPAGARCALLMTGSWGLGPVAEAARALGAAGVHVLAVAGRNARLERRLRAVAREQPRVIPFGFTDRVPELMAASDLVVTSSGDTCSEARVIGRPLLLLDVVPGHGRDNLQHELERGAAEVASARPASLTRSVLACLERTSPPTARVAQTPAAWEQAFSQALGRLGLEAPAADEPRELAAPDTRDVAT